jgi:hypothetical protein
LRQFTKLASLSSIRLKVLEQQLLIGFTVQTSLSGISAFFSKELIEASGEDVFSAASATDRLYDAMFGQHRKSQTKLSGYGLAAIDQVQNQEVMSSKFVSFSFADLFQKAQELRVLDLTMEGYRDLMLIRVAEVGKRLPLPDAGLEDSVGALAGALNQSTFGKGFSNPAIPGELAVEKIFR